MSQGSKQSSETQGRIFVGAGIIAFVGASYFVSFIVKISSLLSQGLGVLDLKGKLLFGLDTWFNFGWLGVVAGFHLVLVYFGGDIYIISP